MLRRVLFVVLFMFACGVPTVATAEDDFVALFDGQSLGGWVQHGGQAKYFVEEGAIVGQSVPLTPNSFLCTEKEYGDFVLELEFKVDPKLNSGVQIRSQVFDKSTTIAAEGGKTRSVAAGRVHGYQYEIDNDPQRNRLWTGGIYDEGRRGWLFPGLRGGDGAAFTEQGRKITKIDDWNALRVEAIGDHFKTWLNGELRADFHDDLTPKGFIALQVHGVGGKTDKLQVRWRNIRIREVKAE
ncbi:MAG: DUF1080 domain-containing protein [Pirellulales bacterium]